MPRDQPRDGRAVARHLAVAREHEVLGGGGERNDEVRLEDLLAPLDQHHLHVWRVCVGVGVWVCGCVGERMCGCTHKGGITACIFLCTHTHARARTNGRMDGWTAESARAHLALERVDHGGELAERRGGDAHQRRAPECAELRRGVELLLLGGELLVPLAELAQLRVQRLRRGAWGCGREHIGPQRIDVPGASGARAM